MSEWRLQIQGGEYGPYSLKQLGQYAGVGRFTPGDLVRHDTSPDWVEAGQVPEITALFSVGTGSGESAAAAPEPPPAPAAKKPRKKGLLRRPLFWIIFILLVLVYLGAVVVSNLPYLYVYGYTMYVWGG